MITDETKLRGIERELAMRLKVYPRLVLNGTMHRADAAREIEIFEAIRDDYKRKIQPGLFSESGSPA